MTLRVTIEIVPHGDETRKETLHVVDIHQVERHDADPGGYRSYEVVVDGEPTENLIPHKRSKGAGMLAASAMAVAYVEKWQEADQ